MNGILGLCYFRKGNHFVKIVINAFVGSKSWTIIKSENKIQVEINGDLFNCSIIKEPLYEIEAMGDQRLPIGTDFEGNIYFRQEGKGMLLGTYEPKSTPWKVEGTPMNFGHELLEPKLDNIEDRLAIGFEECQH